MEMNTRLQVEHPVTEAITGLDLVAWQLRIAAGDALPFKQEDLTPHGHALEVRVYAENPARRFLPSTGVLRHLRFPVSARVDTGVEQGSEVSVHYDPMLAKIITHGENRAEAISRMISALNATEIAGIEHNVGYLRKLVDHPGFRAGDYTTGLADEVHAQVIPQLGLADWLLAGLVSLGSEAGPWSVADGFRLNQPSEVNVYLRQQKNTQRLHLIDDAVECDGQSATWGSVRRTSATIEVALNGVVQRAGYRLIDDRVYLFREGHTVMFVLPDRHVSAVDQRASTGDQITSPMPGQVIRVAVKTGERINSGDLLMVVEAMKMEHEIRAPRAGKVTELLCAVGSRVDDGQELVRLEDVARA